MINKRPAGWFPRGGGSQKSQAGCGIHAVHILLKNICAATGLWTIFSKKTTPELRFADLLF